MAPRALGALLAIVAALAFVVSVASAAWWSGHPIVAGREIGKKDVHVGLLGATGCNTGGDGTCEPVELGSGVVAASYAELGLLGLATVLALLLAASAWRISERRKSIAKALGLTAAVAAIGALAVLSLGPDIKASQAVDVPIGWGVYVLGVALVAALAASAVTARLEPEPLRLKPSIGVPSAPPVDVREILREQHDGLRPSTLGPEPMLGPATAATGPHHGRSSAPLIEGAPQLRPLYDPANAGYVPAPASPALPLHPPTPIPKSIVDAITGNVTPLPDLSPQAARFGPGGAIPSTPNPASPRGHMQSSPPGTRGPLAGASPARANAPSAPPPSRANAPSAPPPARANGPNLPPPARANAPSVPPPARANGPNLPPPARPNALGVPPPARVNAPSIPRPARASAPPPSRASAPSPPDATGDADGRPSPFPRARTIQGPGTDPQISALARRASPQLEPPVPPASPTLAHAVPPMPSADELRAQRAQTEADDRLETAMRETESITAVEIDHEAKATARARITVNGDAQVGDATETNLHIAALAVADTGEDRVVSLGQGGGARAPGEERSIAKPVTIELAAQTSIADALPARTTYELAAQTTPGATDPLDAERMRIGSLTDELAAQGMTDVMAAQRPSDVLAAQGSLSEQLAAQQHDGADITDPSSSPADMLARDAGRTSLPLHASRSPDQTPIPTRSGRVGTLVPLSTAPASLPPPRKAEPATTGPTPACPQCESPMAWVEEHLRFYCRQCRMYF